MKWNSALKIKKQYYHDGSAFFDVVNLKDIEETVFKGAYYEHTPTNLATREILDKCPNLYCFGKVSIEGKLTFEGVMGFPFDDNFANWIYDYRHLGAITRTGTFVFIEWKL